MVFQELSVNRKGKKSFFSRAKDAKVNPKSKPNPQGNTAPAKKSVKTKPKRVKSQADDSSSSIQNLATKPNKPNSRSSSNPNGKIVSKTSSKTSSKTNANRRSPKKVASSQTTKSQRNLKLAIYAITITIGLSTIFGSLISMASAFQTTEAKTTSQNPPKVEVNQENKAKLENLLAIASLGKEINPLKFQLEQLANQYPDLQPEVFLVDLDNKGFVNLNSKAALAAASTIKLPILVAFFQDVDRGQISLDEQLIMTKDDIASGSGSMQYEPPNSKFSALKTAELMMTISDNTATNMLIKRMGGMARLNQRFLKMGLAATTLHELLPDLKGTNTTSAADLGNLLVKIDGGGLVSLRSRDRLLYIMRNIVRNTLLPQGLESGAIIAHKTGDIKSVLGDVGIIDMPNGKRYIASVLVKRPDNSPLAKEFIQKASSTTYQYFKNPQTTSFKLQKDF
jgi:beta-lactamase class A